jgi:osmotically inducible lipoprotein OsmB
MMQLIKTTLLAASVALVSLSGCTQEQEQIGGIAGGAAVGGIIGSAVTGGSAGGAVVGAVGGSAIGYQLTRPTYPRYRYYH